MIKMIRRLLSKGEKTKEEPREETRTKIDDIVDKFMENDAINQKAIPDFVERAIYRNVLTLVTGLMTEVLEGVELQALGHKIKLTVEPYQADETSSSTEAS